MRPETPCWEWPGKKDRNGYGICHGGRKAHRREWERAHGPIPDGHQLHHLCQNRPCMRPDHLLPVTRAEHIKIHQALRTQCRNGHPAEDSVIRQGKTTCKACDRVRVARYRRAA